ncbi:hypothetical protein [Streptomyces sp. GbtcB6]|uniref:hypothetical protein n=1 Tax=Streptomyces sp. GbtcB6 TaxID=2824751 RepID=UPI001C308075|nr:hypothetical protein [Streptomyces sp. GbtcB6]
MEVTVQIVHIDEENWFKDHPSGVLHFQHLLKGEPESPDNYMYVLAKQVGEWSMPRHRHNFEQIRIPLVGSNTTYGRGVELKEGQIGYFPEGLSYGPQESPLTDLKPGEPLALALQFGGSSGYGFMSIDQRRTAMRELVEAGGKFEGALYVSPEGRRQWGLNTVWQHVFGERLKYPRPRYQHPVIADPKRFNWLPVDGSKGVDHKFMGSFSERGVRIEMVRLRPGARWTSIDSGAQRILTVLSGEAGCEGEDLRYLSTLRADAGEQLELAASDASEVEILLIGLPPVVIPEAASEEYDVDPDPDPNQPVHIDSGF